MFSHCLHTLHYSLYSRFTEMWTSRQVDRKTCAKTSTKVNSKIVVQTSVVQKINLRQHIVSFRERFLASLGKKLRMKKERSRNWKIWSQNRDRDGYGTTKLPATSSMDTDTKSTENTGWIPSDFVINPNDVESKLSQINIHKATGPDGLPD